MIARATTMPATPATMTAAQATMTAVPAVTATTVTMPVYRVTASPATVAHDPAVMVVTPLTAPVPSDLLRQTSNTWYHASRTGKHMAAMPASIPVARGNNNRSARKDAPATVTLNTATMAASQVTAD